MPLKRKKTKIKKKTNGLAKIASLTTNSLSSALSIIRKKKNKKKSKLLNYKNLRKEILIKRKKKN